jgi:radical SAM protein (TIGR04043 family)
MLTIEEVLKKKSELLCKGLFIDQKLIDHYKQQGINIELGRKGGAGPLGGRYFKFNTPSHQEPIIVNAALWNTRDRTDLTLGKKEGEYFNIYKNEQDTPWAQLELIENPKYYSPEYKTSDGIPMKKIALVHGIDCLGTTIYQKCKHWECGNACAFCGIELSLKYDTTIVEKTGKQISEVITAAKKEDRCSHMTITSGTESTEDKGALRYIKVLEEIKQSHPDIPLHIQIEPLEDLKYLDRLKDSGADTIGIHIEVLDDGLRKKITPGKYDIPYSLFVKNWKNAIDIFGRNQVESFILTGFGDSEGNLIEDLEDLLSIGVIPFVTPVRSIPGKSPLPQTDYTSLIKTYREVASLMKGYDVNPLENKAGCVRCGGCSAINEAYKALQN